MTQKISNIPARKTKRSLGWLVPAVVVGGLIPVLVLWLDWQSGALGANPIQRATHQTGLLSLVLLILSLACTPVRLWTRWTWPARIRKSLGLLAFGYAVLHMGIYLYDHGFSLLVMQEDIVQRPFITVGFTALLLLIPLALTSSAKAVRRLGFQRWTRLHQLVYLAISLAALHYFWGVKQDKIPPLIYASVILALFVFRWWGTRRKKTRKTKSVF